MEILLLDRDGKQTPGVGICVADLALSFASPTLAHSFLLFPFLSVYLFIKCIGCFSPPNKEPQSSVF